MKIKTADLIGPALDWAVAVADKRTILRTLCKDIVVRGRRADGSEIPDDSYSFIPSEAWSQGGPIIEREKIHLQTDGDNIYWWAKHPAYRPKKRAWIEGPTPLIAAMRCFIASKLGDEVEIPEELLK